MPEQPKAIIKDRIGKEYIFKKFSLIAAVPVSIVLNKCKEIILKDEKISLDAYNSSSHPLRVLRQAMRCNGFYVLCDPDGHINGSISHVFGLHKIMPRLKFLYSSIFPTSIIGTVGYKINPDKRFEMTKLYVSPEYQGRGLGESMCRFIEEKAQSLGVKEITISVLPTKSAIGFYEKMGYILNENLPWHSESFPAMVKGI